MASWVHRKERIVYTAVEIIHLHGVQGLSTKGIAHKEKISESTIFKHFPTKQHLFVAILDYFSQYDQDIVASIQAKGILGIDAIFYFLDTFATNYENYPAITSLVHGIYELQYMENMGERVSAICDFRHRHLLEYIKQAQDKGDIAQAVDSELLGLLMWGGMEEIIKHWRMTNASFSLKKKMNEAVTFFITIK